MIFYAYALGFDEGQFLKHKTWLTLLITGFMGLTTGYLNCSLFYLISRRVNQTLQDYAAFLAVLSVILGLIYGSYINLVSLKQ